MGNIGVLVVDDSMFMRKVITDLLSSDPGIEVVGTARNGMDALEAVRELRPDVITLDIEMPKMDGITALKELMKADPTPVIMVSALTQEGAEMTFDALELGAVDYIAKPSGSISLNMGSVKDVLISKVKAAAKARLKPVGGNAASRKRRRTVERFSSKDKIINIGSSTGGPRAVSELFTDLPKETPPILLVQHMPKFFTKPFSERLDKLSRFSVREAEDGDRVEEGLALVAPGDFHMTVTRNGRIRLHQGPMVHYLRPTVDELMLSTADIYGQRNLGVILTGMGSDGAKGMRAIKEHGGQTIAQDESTCVVFGMPKVAIEQGCVDVVLPLQRIPGEIVRRCGA